MKFEEILQRYNWPVAPEGHHHTTQGWLNLDCVFCSPRSGRFRLGYNLQGRFLSCWSCGSKRLIDTVIAITGLPYGKAKELCGDLPAVKAVPTPRGKLVLPKGLGALLPAHRRYLKGRGYDPDALAKLWGLQGIGNAARLKWRLFIPFLHRGEVVSWTTRGIGEGGLRYVSARPSEEILPAKQTLLFGEDMARHGVVVVEGPFDCFRIGPGAVATLGTGFTQAQAYRVSKYPVRVIAFDNEPMAQQRATKLRDALECFPGKTYLVILDSKDPGSATPREVRALRKLIGG